MWECPQYLLNPDRYSLEYMTAHTVTEFYARPVPTAAVLRKISSGSPLKGGT
jgi:hypothetical protein